MYNAKPSYACKPALVGRGTGEEGRRGQQGRTMRETRTRKPATTDPTVTYDTATTKAMSWLGVKYAAKTSTCAHHSRL